MEFLSSLFVKWPSWSSFCCKLGEIFEAPAQFDLKDKIFSTLEVIHLELSLVVTTTSLFQLNFAVRFALAISSSAPI